MYKIYQIEYGDTLDTIATKTNTTVDNIKMINGITDDYEIYVGNLIIVPNETNDIFTTYVVQNGDNIYTISRMYNIDPTTLLMINGLNKDDYIYPNQEIMVPNDDVSIYITKEGDTIDMVLDNFGIDIETLIKENNKIFLETEQLLVHKKERNN